MQNNDLKDPKLEQIIKELQAMRKEFEELETKLANRELENKND
jgi:DNA-binding protein YbaB